MAPGSRQEITMREDVDGLLWNSLDFHWFILVLEPDQNTHTEWVRHRRGL